jgi:hypothetical protein
MLVYLRSIVVAVTISNLKAVPKFISAWFPKKIPLQKAQPSWLRFFSLQKIWKPALA